MFTIQFWKEALERAVKTAAQAIILGLGIGEGFNIFDVDVALAAGFAGGGMLLSLLTSIATAPFTGGQTASLVPTAKTRGAVISEAHE